MSKELPYFKFKVAEWLIGDIVYEDFDVQGFFINICAVYWQKGGILTILDIEKRYKKPELFSKIIEKKFIKIKKEFIKIDFLDEQLHERTDVSKKNKKNGALGGRPKLPKILEKKPNGFEKKTQEKKSEKPNTKTEKTNKEKEQEEDKEKENKERDFFNEFRIIYPGIKYGNDTEFEKFKKHKDWKDILPKLKEAVEGQIKNRCSKKSKNEFIPEWKNLSTWINQRCWEEETTVEKSVFTNVHSLRPQN